MIPDYLTKKLDETWTILLKILQGDSAAADHSVALATVKFCRSRGSRKG